MPRSNRKTNRRRRRSAEEIDRILNDYASSGQTQAEFASRRGVALSTLTGWLRRSRAEVEPPASFAGFAEVVAEGPVALPRAADHDFELVFGGGSAERIDSLRVRAGCGAADLRRVLEVVGALPDEACSS